MPKLAFCILWGNKKIALNLPQNGQITRRQQQETKKC